MVAATLLDRPRASRLTLTLTDSGGLESAPRAALAGADQATLAGGLQTQQRNAFVEAERDDCQLIVVRSAAPDRATQEQR